MASTLTTSFRFDAETKAAIKRLEARTGRSRTAVVSEAIRRYDSSWAAAGTPAERVADLIGALASGMPSGSMGIGQRLTAALEAKQRASR